MRRTTTTSAPLVNTPPGGFVMNATVPAAETLTIDLLNGQSWYTDQLFTGTIQPGGAMSFQMPTLGVGVNVTFSVAATDASGNNVHPIGSTTQLFYLGV
jgi:hypothetical protein